MLNKIFKLEERNTNFKTEIIAGISTFFTLSFIIAVNPAILSDAGIDFAAGFVATIIASALGCFMIGIWAGWPVAIAPGMGLNAYFAYVVVLGYGFSWRIQRLNTRRMGYFNFWFDMVNFKYNLKRYLT